MGVGWAINSAMVILAATTFFAHGMVVDDLAVAAATLSPHLGPGELDHLCRGAAVRGTIEQRDSGHGGGNHHCGHVRRGIRYPRPTFLDRGGGLFRRRSDGVPGRPKSFWEGLIWSQALLSLQLPITVFVLIRLTSSPLVMGKYANSRPLNALLVGIGAIVTILDVVLLTGM